MQGMMHILIGTLVLSTIHAATPHHWFPIIAIGKTEDWSWRETMWVTVITGVSHTSSTIAIGVIVGLIGHELSSAHELVTRIAAPLILIAMGLIYIFLGIRKSHHHSNTGTLSKKSKVAVVTSLSVAMFLTPCTEIEVYYFTAGALLGWYGIAIVSITYLAITVLIMLLLVYFGFRGFEKIRSQFIEHYDKQITGVILVILGLWYLV